MEGGMVELQQGKMPLVGLGTWKLALDICSDVVYTAIKVCRMMEESLF